MVLDTSAVVAILLHEPDEARLKVLIQSSATLYIGAPTVVEALLVMGGRRGLSGTEEVRQLIDELAVEVVPFSERHVLAAESAFLQFGKGRHPAGLNFGDCMAYAIAKVANLPLLYIGNDFTQTDIPAA